MIKIICPECKTSELTVSGDVSSCPGCGYNCQAQDGILDLDKSIPYYGEVSRERMMEIIVQAREKGWKRALIDNFYYSYNFLYNIAADEARADWIYLLDLKKNHSVLDVGSGWGTEAIPLAKNCRTTVALDGTRERLEFLRVRAGQENVNNLLYIKASILDPPLADEQFDLAVLNGVLEWVGTADTESDPQVLQQAALCNVFRLLKKGGRLYLGIENSHGFKYLLGEPDDHTGIRNISFLPREEADRIMRAQRGSGYRTYTYSYSGYLDLLKKAGFDNVEFYYPKPDYKFFNCLFPLNSASILKYVLENIVPDTLAGSVTQNTKNLETAVLPVGSLRDSASSYSIIAEKM